MMYERKVLDLSRRNIKNVEVYMKEPEIESAPAEQRTTQMKRRLQNVADLQGTVTFWKGHTGLSNPQYHDKFRGIRAFSDAGL